MNHDQRLNKLAKLLVNYSISVKSHDKVNLSGTIAALPLIKEIYKEILKAGAFPNIRLTFEDEEYLFYKYAQNHQLDYCNPFRKYETENIDSSISIFAGFNPHSLTSIPAEKKQRAIKAREPIMEAVFKRWGEGDFTWVGSLCPSSALAQEAKMSLSEYSEFVFSCMHLDENDPISFWADFSAKQEKICKIMDNFKQFRYLGKDTDLTFSCEGRKWINCDGKNNFPDGEIFTGPVESSVEGQIRFTYPGIFQGEEIEDITLEFRKGKVVKARAKTGEALLHHILDTDEGARFVGEIAIGTNYNINKFTKNMLFDEKMGGTVHLAIGRGIPQSGSLNQSAIHWDMLKDMKNNSEIQADGQTIYKNGKFLI